MAGNGNGRKNRRIFGGLSPQTLLSDVARRLYAAALAQGRSGSQVPALAALGPLAEVGMRLSTEEQAEFINAYETLYVLFGLDRTGVDLLLTSVAIELDERLYLAAIDITGTPVGAAGPRVGGILSLLYPDLTERVLAQRALREDSPLQAFRMIRLLSSNKNAPLSQRELCAEPAILPHIVKGFDFPPLPAQLCGVAQLYGPADLDALDGELEPELHHRLKLLLTAQGTARALHLHLSSARNAPSVARQIAAGMSRPVVLLDLRAVDTDHDEKVAIALREARLRNGLAFFLNPMSLSDEEYSTQIVRQYAQQWRRMLAVEPRLVLFGSEEPESRDVDILPSIGLDMSTYKFSGTTLERRRQLFQTALEGAFTDQAGDVIQLKLSPDVSFDYLASVYRVDEAEVRAIVSQAAADARVRVVTVAASPVIDTAILRHAAREKTHRDVGKFAKLVSSRYTWEDLVLPEDIKEILGDFSTSARRRARVYEEWGFSKKHARGLGLCAVFSGESGTGKTMSAEVLANELGVNMYQVDISAVVSKWLGETERHLAQIFDATENSDSILFFDEADAIFGKRTEVNESKDRYANVEISYLLQRIEQYSGIVILSTNLRSNMDEAFLRRLQFGIQFPMPEYEGRREMWRRAFPAETPLDDGVSFDFLAKEYDELSGGQIRLIAIGAAMLAAGQDSKVTMKILHRAFLTERIKMQRVITVEPTPARRATTLTGRAQSLLMKFE